MVAGTRHCEGGGILEEDLKWIYSSDLAPFCNGIEAK